MNRQKQANTGRPDMPGESLIQGPGTVTWVQTPMRITTLACGLTSESMSQWFYL